MSNSEQRPVMVRLEMEDLADDSNIERYIDHLESQIEQLKASASAVLVDYRCAIDMMEFEDEADESRELADALEEVISKDSNHE